MVECNSSSGSYTVKYWCPGPIEICEAFPGHRSHILGRTPSYFSLVSCSLSVLGSLLIVFSYWRWKDIRTGSRSIVTFLSVADFFTAAGYIVAGGNYLHYYGQYEATPECVWFQQICEMQSFITTWSSMASFAWTSILAVYLYLTIVHRRVDMAASLIPIGHVLAWVLPFAIVFPLLCTGKLGFSMVATSNWCYIQDSREKNALYSTDGGQFKVEVTLLALVAGKLWEIITYVIVLVFYGLIKYHIRKETNHGSFLSQGVRQAALQIDRKLTFIPVVFILLRMWGTIQFFYTLAVDRHIQCGCVSNGVWKGFFILGILQAVGDGGQGWGNAILYIFASKVLRERLIGSLWRSLKWCSLCKCLWTSSTQNSNLAHRQNASIQRRRTRSSSPGKVGIAASSWLQRNEGEHISFDHVEGGQIVFESPGKARYTPPRCGVRGQRRNSHTQYEPTTMLSDGQ